MTSTATQTQQPAAPAEERQIHIHLRKIPLLAELSDDEITFVKQEIRIRQYNKRDIVLQKGGHGDGLMFLLGGQAQVIDVTEDGRAIGLRLLAPGDFFGEIALINNSTRSASVVAMTDVLVGFLPAPAAMHLMSHFPSVANQMLKHLAQKIQRDSEIRALLSINNTSKRIYAFLVMQQKKDDDPNAPAVVENLPTHQDIANMVNTSRETVTRALLALVQQGIVQKEPHRLIIRDPDALKKLVQAT
ncbi:Crp/Fnr family transcriptional regulator [Massilia agilis]|uniref:Crp/Fnr family transcriptional regulator n=1 Tax=Massilia agilis TaxID=1811226 RepID=A0ABT2DF42_9BURK|nr:Crp/Fnr family transcriptional regulator [Massilia agilis]MCS0809941.1 Crp/Fnr family transcriptional regulator [Massilia agilis]